MNLEEKKQKLGYFHTNWSRNLKEVNQILKKKKKGAANMPVSPDTPEQRSAAVIYHVELYLQIFKGNSSAV